MEDEDTSVSVKKRYSIEQLALGSYDLLLDDRLIGGIVSSVFTSSRLSGWRVELLDKGGQHRPHLFTGLDAALSWLGVHDAASA